MTGSAQAEVLNLGGWPDLPWPSSRPTLGDILTSEAAAFMLDGQGRVVSEHGHPAFEIARAYFEGRRIFREAGPSHSAK